MQSRRQGRIRFIVASLIAVLVLLSGCSFHASIGGTNAATDSSSAGNGTYTGNGVTFNYPTTWHGVTLGSVTAKSQDAEWDKVVGPTGLDFAVVAEYTLPVSITAANLDQAKVPVTTTIKNLFTQAGGALATGPTVSTMGGYPSFEYTGSAKAPTGDSVQSRMVLAFNGSSEYFVNCQYTPAHQQDILAGCDQIVSSFRTT